MEQSTKAIIDKIQKLLAMAQAKGGNEHEAASAAAMAQRMMIEHGVTVEEVAEAVTGESEAEKVKVHETGKRVSWKIELLDGLAKANFCRFVWRNTGACEYYVCWRTYRVEIVRSLFDYLAQEIDRLTEEALSSAKEIYRSPENAGASSWRKWAADHRYGMAKRISERLKEQFKQQREQGIPDSNVSALAVVSAYQKALAEIKTIIGKVRITANGPSTFSGGLAVGYEAGNRVGIDPQVKPGKGHPTRALAHK